MRTRWSWRFRGALDLASAPALERELVMAESVCPDRIVVDLRGLQFMDSTGLHMPLQAHRRSHEEHHYLALLRGRRLVDRMFELTGAHDIFAFEASESRSLDFPLLSRLLGGDSPIHGELISYLLFDREFIDALIELGQRDARRALRLRRNQRDPWYVEPLPAFKQGPPQALGAGRAR